MKGQFISVLLVMLAIFSCMGSASGATHYVGPGDFLSVIAGSDSGDTVIFTDGLYHVNDPIYILDSLSLIAQHYGGATLRAESSVNSMIDVLVPRVTISGLVLDGNHKANDGIHGGFSGDNTQNGHFTSNVIRNCNNYGIFLNNSAYSVFSNNGVDGGRLGIAVLYSPLADLSSNRITNVECTGITVGESQLVTLTGNTVSGSGQDGILIRQSLYSRLEDNNAWGNAWNGIALDRSSNSLIMDNIARNNGDCGIYLRSTGLTSVLLSDLLYNDNGVVISGGKDNNILGNNINFNNIGVQMWTNNNISYNNITNNIGTGIYVGSNQNSVDTYRIFNNTIIWNLNGILISGSQNDINPDLLRNNGVFGNNYMLTVQGNGNLLNETILYGNTNGLRIIGNDNILTNITAVYNSLTGIIINGMGNTLDSSFILNNTNGISITGNTNTINSILILNTTNGLTLNGNENLINGTEVINSTNGISIMGNINTINSVLILNTTNGLALNGNQNIINRTEILNGTNGIIVTGNKNNITNNNVYNNSNNGIYVSGDNLVTGNYITYNNGTGLVIQTDNNNVNLTNTLLNMIFNNGGGITLIGDGNDLDNVLMLFNIFLNNDYALTITGNNNRLNNTIFTLNKNGLQVNGDNNSFTNITARNNNETGIIVNGNNNNINSSSIENNTNGLAVNGNQNTVNGTQINNNTNGILINGSENTLNQTNIHNNSQTAVTLNGYNNTLLQNNITGSNGAILVENGTNNTINYNRIAQNNHSLTNNGNGTVNASYNWWGQNNPIGITGANIDISNHVIANLNIQNVDNIIRPGEVYNVTLTLRSADGQELALEIPSFFVQFSFDGDIYPEEAAVVNNSLETQLQVFNPGSYTLKVLVDQQILTKTLSTPVNSQPTMNRVSIKPKAIVSGAYRMNSLSSVSLGLKVSASSVITPPEGMSPEKSVKWKFQYYNSLSDPEKLQFLQNPTIPKFTNDETDYISKYFNENYNDFKDKKTEAAAAAVAISSLAGLAFLVVLSGGTLLGSLGLGGLDLSGLITVITGALYALRGIIIRYGSIIVNELVYLSRNAGSWLSNNAVNIISKLGIEVDNAGPGLLSRFTNFINPFSFDTAITMLEYGAAEYSIPVLNSLFRSGVYKDVTYQLATLEISEFLRNPKIYLQNSGDNVVQAGNYIVNAVQSFNNNIKPVLNRFNKEMKEFKQKGLEYVETKYQQAKTYVKKTTSKAVNYYNSKVKPTVEKYVKHITHRILNRVVNHPVYKAVRNVPVIKQGLNLVSWGAKKLGFW